MAFQYESCLNDIRYTLLLHLYCHQADARAQELFQFSHHSDGGIPVRISADDCEDITIVDDGGGGAIAVWQNPGGGNDVIYAQRVDQDGTVMWTANGVSICGPAASYKQDPHATADGEGGAIMGFRAHQTSGYDILAQRIDADGNLLWGPTGTEVCAICDIGYNPTMQSDGAGGSFIIWRDTRFGLYDLFGQLLGTDGRLGYHSPDIFAVRDVPGDQGGSVYLSWYASRLDVLQDSGMSHYTIWRAIEPEAAMLAIDDGARTVSSISEIGSDPSGPVIRTEVLGGSTVFWEYIETQQAWYLEGYSTSVPTLFNSTGVSTEDHYFQVIAHTSDPGEFYVSLPDTGYSVDNLAPAAPLGLAGEQSYSPEGLQLTWDPNSEADLAGYNIYRGTSDSFVPGPGNFVTSTPDTASFDDEWSWDTGYWYKVAAFDIHGNESTFAVLSPDMLTGDEPMPVPDATFLAQNYPNPFNPNTSIAFGLKERGYVALRVYNAAGRLIRTLADGTMHAGTYEITWNGFDNGGNHVSSGVYFYRLTAKEFEETKKMILLR